MMRNSRIVVFGDWHGNAAWAKKMFSQAFHRSRREGWSVDCFVQVGDFGVWREDWSTFSQAIEKHCGGKTLYFVEGNHEDYPYLRQLCREVGANPDGTFTLSPHIVYCPRGTHLTLNGGVSCLFVGGATSIDQQWRTEGEDWFPEEEISEAELNLIVDTAPQTVDVLFTHDAPFLPRGLPPMNGVDEKVMRSAENNRNALKEIAAAVRPRFIVHGHYHKKDDFPTPFGGFQVSLDKDNTWFNAHTAYVCEDGSVVRPDPEFHF